MESCLIGTHTKSFYIYFIPKFTLGRYKLLIKVISKAFFMAINVIQWLLPIFKTVLQLKWF